MWNEIFGEVDVDGDGDISFQEFTLCMHSALKNQNVQKYYIRQSHIDPELFRNQDKKAQQMFSPLD